MTTFKDQFERSMTVEEIADNTIIRIYASAVIEQLNVGQITAKVSGRRILVNSTVGGQIEIRYGPIALRKADYDRIGLERLAAALATDAARPPDLMAESPHIYIDSICGVNVALPKIYLEHGA